MPLPSWFDKMKNKQPQEEEKPPTTSDLPSISQEEIDVWKESLRRLDKQKEERKEKAKRDSALYNEARRQLDEEKEQEGIPPLPEGPPNEWVKEGDTSERKQR